MSDKEASAVATAPVGGVSLFDFSKPNKFGLAHVRSLEGLHETFARRFAASLTHALRCVVQLKPLAVDELTYESYVRSLPNPSILTVVSLPPLPGVVVEMSSHMGLLLVERVLGGIGLPGAIRRPTDLEVQLLKEIMTHSLAPLKETFAPLIDVAPAITSVESNPHVAQVVSPSETVLLLSYSFALSGFAPHEGLLTLCYPYSTLQSVLDRLELHAKEQPPGEDVRSDRMATHIADAAVTLEVRLRPSLATASEIAALRPGDVLRLDHQVDQPALGAVQGKELIEGYVGRAGKRLGFRISDWRMEDDR